ncbi:unnamed protein product [Mesocestoides corti]|uniref:Uncharacterized protein n=1 Tax=Mesocestoides corti TaxID=53468 RepID=A0A0R3UB19_MESCO|nr:unnamed protein product [Mesocestoides corti]
MANIIKLQPPYHGFTSLRFQLNQYILSGGRPAIPPEDNPTLELRAVLCGCDLRWNSPLSPSVSSKWSMKPLCYPNHAEKLLLRISENSPNESKRIHANQSGVLTSTCCARWTSHSQST